MVTIHGNSRRLFDGEHLVVSSGEKVFCVWKQPIGHVQGLIRDVKDDLEEDEVRWWNLVG